MVFLLPRRAQRVQQGMPALARFTARSLDWKVKRVGLPSCRHGRMAKARRLVAAAPVIYCNALAMSFGVRPRACVCACVPGRFPPAAPA